MNSISPTHLKKYDKHSVSNEELYQLIDYLFCLKEKNFTGHLEIDFRQGSVNQVAFNQKTVDCLNLSVNR